MIKIKLLLCVVLLSFVVTIGYTQNYMTSAKKFSKFKYRPSYRDVGQKRAIASCDLFVAYQYSYVVDTADMSKCNEQMVLEIGSNVNRFYSRYSDIRDSLMYRQMKKEYKQNGYIGAQSDPAHFFLKNDERVIYNDIYTFPKNKNRMVSLRAGRLEYRYKEILEPLDWTIISGTETISGYTCRKAETEFRGRKWYAWFAEELPYSFGPWKLSGLPGLILKAEDSEGLFEWKAIEVQKPASRAIYVYSSDSEPSFDASGLMPKFKIKECEREEVAKLWQRYWVAPISMLFIQGGKPVVHTRDESGKSQKVEIDMDNLPNIYYPRLELDL